VLIVAGNLAHWRWVNAAWFRLLHLGAIAFVVGQTWLGITCPLTTLEVWLRTQAGAGTYSGGFIEHWVQQVLFYSAPPWVFNLAYSLFGLLVVAVWVLFPPELKRRGKHGDQGCNA
jgi:polyferredoxin